MGLLDKKKSLLTDEQSHWGDVANRLGADISNYGGSALRGLLKGTVGLPVGLHNLVSDVTGRGSQIDTLSPEWVGKKVEPYLPDGNTKTEIAGEFINPFGAIKAASIPLMGLMFAGKNAKTADLFKLRKAEEMLKKGVSDRDAYAKTGWTHGFADKKPRFEIDDSGARIAGYDGTNKTDSMMNILDHNKLYDNYPGQQYYKDVELTSKSTLPEHLRKALSGTGDGSYTNNWFASDNPKIKTTAYSPEDTSVTLHELQHDVQAREGFAAGGSPDYYMRKRDNARRKINGLIDDYSKGRISSERELQDVTSKFIQDAHLDPYKSYKNLAGEAEARLTQARKDMTAAERAKSYPPDMFDVPVEDQIVRFDGGKRVDSISALKPKADFYGDKTYKIDATGDAVVGDEVSFDRAVFSGSFRNPRFDGYQNIKGKIIKDSYGAEKQQHTFTVELPDGSKTRIKGRNLYKEGTYRKPWKDESLRKVAAEEKHKRGDVARSRRDIRKNETFGGLLGK